MNKRGFTLVEMLIVIALLAVLFGVVLPRVVKFLGSADKRNYETKKSLITNAAELYVQENRYALESEDSYYDEYFVICVNDLIREGYLEADVIYNDSEGICKDPSEEEDSCETIYAADSDGKYVINSGNSLTYMGENGELENSSILETESRTYCCKNLEYSTGCVINPVDNTVLNDKIVRVEIRGNRYLGFWEDENPPKVWARNLRYDNTNTKMNCFDAQCAIDTICEMVR